MPVEYFRRSQRKSLRMVGGAFVASQVRRFLFAKFCPAQFTVSGFFSTAVIQWYSRRLLIHCSLPHRLPDLPSTSPTNGNLSDSQQKIQMSRPPTGSYPIRPRLKRRWLRCLIGKRWLASGGGAHLVRQNNHGSNSNSIRIPCRQCLKRLLIVYIWRAPFVQRAGVSISADRSCLFDFIAREHTDFLRTVILAGTRLGCIIFVFQKQGVVG